MNPLVKKEIRLLLPSFGIGCALTFANWFLLWERMLLENSSAINSMLFLIPLAVCPAVAVMIALNSFGAEISSGTFSMLLSQPVSRLKIWETKISLLAVTLLVFGVLWFVPIFYIHMFCLRTFMVTDYDSSLDIFNLFAIAVTFALVVFSGGLWTVLLLRQVAAALWITVLVPGCILVILVGLLADHSGEFIEGMVVSVLGIYSLVGFFFARWLFFQAQDVQWSGGTIVLPEMRGPARLKSFAGTRRVWRPRAALWRKEIQLQQSQFIIAFALLALHLGDLATRKLGHFRKNSTTEFILEGFWILWLVMPLLVGCAAVAEERKLGTHEGQLCLPARRRTQFAVKLLVTFGLSVLLGVVIPLLLEGVRILPDVHFEFGTFSSDWWRGMSTTDIFLWNCLGTLSGLLPRLALTAIALLIGGISFYASTLARNTLQTLAPAVAGIVTAWFLIQVGANVQQFVFAPPWHGPLPLFIVLPTMVLTLLALAYSNFKRVLTGWKLVSRNTLALVFIFALTVTLTSAIYHRAWEKFTPFEPPHGVARLSLSDPADLSREDEELSVRLPDGKFWMSWLTAYPNGTMGAILGNYTVALTVAQYFSGSNWVTVKPIGGWQCAGIKTDGTLWVSEQSLQHQRQSRNRWTNNWDKMFHLVQFGEETNWSSLAFDWPRVLLVKRDGTLWRWGAPYFDTSSKQWQSLDLRSFVPRRFGADSNWAEVFRGNGQVRFLKKDGTAWMSESWNTNRKTLLKIEPGYTVVQAFDNSRRDEFRSITTVAPWQRFKVGVRNDGSFRILADERYDQKRTDYEWFSTNVQLGPATNWVAAAGSGEKVVTLKDDGTLWLWDFHYDYRRGWNRDRIEGEMSKCKPVRLGTHSDWIAISGDSASATALAADGSLWLWPLADANRVMGFSGSILQSADHSEGELPLLDISRKPQFLANIFGKAN